MAGGRVGRPARSSRSRRFSREPTGPSPLSAPSTSSPPALSSIQLDVCHSASCSNVPTMDTDVWILGGCQSDFARNLTKEGLDFADLTREIVDATLAAAQVNATKIGVVHVANAFGEMFAEQGHLGAMPATVCDGLWDTPASRHEAACASGSVATLAAMADLRSGNYDAALVVGVELEKTVPGDTAARHLGAAAWTGHEGADAKFLWPSMFAQVADEYDR